MLRPKSAGGRSFLDDLLGNDDSDAAPASAGRQRKSVRFFDEDEAPGTTLAARPHSSTLDSLLNPETRHLSPRPLEPTKKADWLGIGGDDDADIFRPPTATAKPEAKSIGVSRNEPDWITNSLKARQASARDSESKPSFLQPAKEPEPKPTWQPKVAEPKPAVTLSRSQPSESDKVLQEEAVAETKVESEIDLDQGEPTSATAQSVTLLQTKLRIVTLEKSFLQQTVEQMKTNHQQELNAMVSLYEQQMRLTSDMYRRHEEMIQEERDRRISELKSQLEHSEAEASSMREKYQQRLATVEAEWKNDVKRIQDMYAVANRQISNEHQNEIRRLEDRIRVDSEQSAELSTGIIDRQNRNVTELLAKWEESAHKIEQLQRSVVARQEELFRQHNNSEREEIWKPKLSEIEAQYKQFIAQLQQQKDEFEKTIKAEQDRVITTEQAKINEKNSQLDEQKSEMEEMRQEFAREVNEWRQKESVEVEKLQRKRDKLREEVLIFEEKRSMLETVYAERSRMNEEEQNRLAKQAEMLNKKQMELDQQQIQLNRSLMEMRAEQNDLQNRKQQFDREKEQLTLLGQTLTNKAEELEKLSEVALKEKLDGIQAIDEIDSFRAEIQTRMAEIEKANSVLSTEKQRISMERNQLEQQWLMLKELKESVICNLCGSSLNKGSLEKSQQSLFPTVINGGYLLRQNIVNTNVLMQNGSNWNNHDDDQSLLFWQMAAQKDAASLAEETKFVNFLVKKPN